MRFDDAQKGGIDGFASIDHQADRRHLATNVIIDRGPRGHSRDDDEKCKNAEMQECRNAFVHSCIRALVHFASIPQNDCLRRNSIA